jgi:hypothetical protein
MAYLLKLAMGWVPSRASLRPEALCCSASRFPLYGRQNQSQGDFVALHQYFSMGKILIVFMALKQCRANGLIPSIASRNA